MELERFRKLLNKKKPFRDLSDEYKTDKFLKLYLKIYEYMDSIPKENIVYTYIKNHLMCGFIGYIRCFLIAKDFYNWRQRIYTLLTKRIHNANIEKWRLLYNSKAEELHNMSINNMVESYRQYYIQNFGVTNPSQLEEVKEKRKSTNLERHGAEYYMATEEFREKSKESSLKKWGTENPMQSKEVQDKVIATWVKNYGTDHPLRNKKVLEKMKGTNLDRYGVINTFLISQHKPQSNIANEFCTNLYSMLPDDIKPYTIFYKKDNKEYMLRDKDRIFRYDFTISSECVKVIVEFDGIYWHGLIEGQKYVKNKPVEKVWEEDLEKQRLAESMGFRVIRVREDEYMEDKEGCIMRILNIIRGMYE